MGWTKICFTESHTVVNPDYMTIILFVCRQTLWTHKHTQCVVLHRTVVSGLCFNKIASKASSMPEDSWFSVSGHLSFSLFLSFSLYAGSLVVERIVIVCWEFLLSFLLFLLCFIEWYVSRLLWLLSLICMCSVISWLPIMFLSSCKTEAESCHAPAWWKRCSWLQETRWGMRTFHMPHMWIKQLWSY